MSRARNLGIGTARRRAATSQRATRARATRRARAAVACFQRRMCGRPPLCGLWPVQAEVCRVRVLQLKAMVESPVVRTPGVDLVWASESARTREIVKQMLHDRQRGPDTITSISFLRSRAHIPHISRYPIDNHGRATGHLRFTLDSSTPAAADFGCGRFWLKCRAA